MKKIICGIYKITTPSGKIYIGQSVDVNQRRIQHRCKSNRYKCPLHSAFIKYGFDNCKFEIIEECEEQQLDEREIYWINFFNTLDIKYGLNLKSGGANGRHSELSKKKMSETNKGRSAWNKGLRMSREYVEKRIGRKASDETRQKIRDSIAKTKRVAWNKGLVLSKEHKESLSKAKIGTRLSKETREKIALVHRGRTRSIETIEKMKLAASKRPPITQETKNKISKTLLSRKSIIED